MWRWRTRPATCGVTVTDSNAPLRPISLRYVGTSRDAARAIVTDGAKLAGAAAAAAPSFDLLQADVETSANAMLRQYLNVDRLCMMGVAAQLLPQRSS